MVHHYDSVRGAVLHGGGDGAGGHQDPQRRLRHHHPPHDRWVRRSSAVMPGVVG